MADKYKYRIEIQQMMFVSGENNEPSLETTSLIEDIVRAQVIEILMQAQRTCLNRGTRSISPEDVIFLIRHDKAKVNRLRTYLSWKDLRKNAKDQDPAAAGADAGAGADDFADDKDKKDKAPDYTKVKKSKIRLPWELQFMFNEQPLENDDNDDLDEDEREANLATLKRLKMADDRTRDMTKEEYVHWSDCRQASFTFRKGKRFRDWSGISTITDGKPHDDVIDILGFLTFEIVCSLTETALEVKKKEENILNANRSTQREKKRKGLFDGPDIVANPLKTRHVLEAWRVLQNADRRHRSIKNFKGGRFSSRQVIV